MVKKYYHLISLKLELSTKSNKITTLASILYIKYNNLHYIKSRVSLSVRQSMCHIPSVIR